MQHANQEERRKEERQILKEKQQVKKEKEMFDTRLQNEEGKIRARKIEKKAWNEKKKGALRVINSMSISVAFRLRGSHPREFLYFSRKYWKAMIRLVSLILHNDRDYYCVKGRRTIRRKKEG